jgi:YYY domain-containing protein
MTHRVKRRRHDDGPGLKMEKNQQIPLSIDFKKDLSAWIRRTGWTPFILAAILLVAALLRIIGFNWDEYTHLHPDERFLTSVEASLEIPASIGEYFDTSTSTFNPHNTGNGFFVYGTLPIFVVRVVGEWLGRTGYDEIHLVGRAVSTAFDLLSIGFIYLIAERLFNRRTGLLAAGLAASTVLFIQQAHYFTVDSTANFFVVLGMFFAVKVAESSKWQDYAFFGLALGCAVASKINTFPMALILVMAVVVYLRREDHLDERAFSWAFLYLIMAAAVSLVVFRIFQPYTFKGPGFFDVGLNPQWLENMQELRGMNAGNTDAPYALQWADRAPIWFSLKNMILWGLGLPLGLTSIIGLALAGIELVRGNLKHLLLVPWTLLYFIWQSTGFTPAMRYQLPIYPSLILMAAWALWYGYDWVHNRSSSLVVRRLYLGFLGLVLAGTALWAIAFTSIYARPLTRVEASRWMFDHIPGAVNLIVEQGEDELFEPVAVPLDLLLYPQAPFDIGFQTHTQGQVAELYFPFTINAASAVATLDASASILGGSNGEQLISSGARSGDLEASLQGEFSLELIPPAPLTRGESYWLDLQLSPYGELSFDDSVEILVDTPTGPDVIHLALETFDQTSSETQTEHLAFTSHLDGLAASVVFSYRLEPVSAEPAPVELLAEILTPEGEVLVSGNLDTTLTSIQPEGLFVSFDSVLPIQDGDEYRLRLSLLSDQALIFQPSTIVHETTWDDGLPWGVDGRTITGRYDSLNLELYWHDDQDDDGDGLADKLERMVEYLAQADYLVISSNRQYGTITRVPIRYPLTIAYYRALIGCPEPEDVISCYYQAQPGQVEGQLGYDLIEVFDSNPQIGPLEFNDQYAEEAFTVYDHPKVFIFQRAEDFSAEAVLALLSQVDLSQVQHILPRDVGGGESQSMQPDIGSGQETTKTLMLSTARWEEVRQEGTWSDLFDRESLLNRSHPVGVVVWWSVIALMGWLVFPITFVVFPGLKDRGFAITRVIGLLLLAWLSWLLGSAGVKITPSTIALVLLGLVVLSGLITYFKRQELWAYLSTSWKDLLRVELTAVVFFLVFLFIRLGNPDLWHPAKGGEKPMDLSYLNAVLKSTTFPPYDPWFAGGYINYYYFGFVIVGMPVKLLGLVPSFAYNLIIPTLFATLALAGYCVGYNLVAVRFSERWQGGMWNPRTAGLAAAIFLVVAGNLGTVKLFYDGFRQMAADGGVLETGPAGWLQAAEGVVDFVGAGGGLPVPIDQWYWNPSRAIPPGEGEIGAITEFPFFTFLYADLHAHMISRLLTVSGIAWMLSLLLTFKRQERVSWYKTAGLLFIGGLILGGLSPTNTWDYPVYWVLGGIAALVAPWLEPDRKLAPTVIKSLAFLVGIALLYRLLYLPYHLASYLPYGRVDLYNGSHTSLNAYFGVHGVFLFIIVSWMAWETRQWMAQTPLSALGELKPFAGQIIMAAATVVLLTLVVAALGYPVIIYVIPLGTWALLLMFRPHIGLPKQLVLFLFGVGLALTFMVEVIVLRGDIGRMNTVFKFYLQVWEMFAISAGAAMVWTLLDLYQWNRKLQLVWSLALMMLIGGALLYPLTATPAKMRDRFAMAAPHTLDGMAFMKYVNNYFDQGYFITLEEDYDAIRWMQDNIHGSPVIVEVSTPEYRWGSRFTVYTGLPGVVGWHNHQQQQRGAAMGEEVSNRIIAISNFYNTRSIDAAMAFLTEYQVSYIVVGGLERAYFEFVDECYPAPETGGVNCSPIGRPLGAPNPEVQPSECEPQGDDETISELTCPTYGLDKFELMAEMGLLEAVYREGSTVIYEVVR